MVDIGKKPKMLAIYEGDFILGQTKAYKKSNTGIRMNIKYSSNGDSKWKKFYDPEMSIHELNEWYQNNPY